MFAIRPRRGIPGVLLLGLMGVAACSDGDPTGPGETPFGTFIIDAVDSWAFVSIDDDVSEIQVTDPGASADWDLGFFATGVMLNGGAAGPGGVEAYCICQNDGASDEQVKAMTPDSELADFEAVTALQIPADASAWLSDELVPAIDGWWSYNMQTHAVTPVTTRAWKVRTAEGTAFAKLRVAGFANAAQQIAGQVTLEFATQSGTGQPLGPVQSLVVDVSGGPVYVDLLDGAVSDASDWDLRLEGWEIRVNGGVSGTGTAGAVDAGEPFAGITDAGDVPARVYKGDAFGGIFGSKPWYRYNLNGDDHQIWPTFQVYLVRKGQDVYKLQLTSYYQPSTGAERHISFRYEKLDPPAN